jgi:23S rRNA pseudouridine2605 synthase
MAEERLQKILARAGIASRRKCEEYIAEGRVTVDGAAVTEMGVKVDCLQHEVCFDGKPVHFERKVYYVLYKPRGVICTQRDPQGRKRAVDLLRGVRERVFPVGRLDMDSEGLLILTNDGEFGNRIAHPRHEISKSYIVDVQGLVAEGQIRRLTDGVRLEEGIARVQKARVLARTSEVSRLLVTLAEGKKREIRRMLDSLGFPVLKIKRIRIGSLRVGTLMPGQHRELTTEEVRALMSCARTGEMPRQKRRSGSEEGKAILRMRSRHRARRSQAE